MSSVLLICATTAFAGPAEDEVRHAQLWHEMKLNEASATQEQLEDAEDDLQKAKKRLQDAQKSFDEATQKRDLALKKNQDAQAAIKAADSRLDKAWSVMDQQKKSVGN
ncbi:hypothetical protein LIN78_10105 [Leeia sp. TBRC 13508]|uniref:Uncharacterized protein n=1 Tax=Leeia speluncae TaxID=2884804 RepID=A0ABS8D7D8_9NEIS|nr:hypothetical protein [Leeia speluncae]MCB6183896.1 hypothetical protein [Leeia speluncae]